MINPILLIDKAKAVIDSCDNMKQFKPCIAYVKLIHRELNDPGYYVGLLGRIEKRFIDIVNGGVK